MTRFGLILSSCLALGLWLHPELASAQKKPRAKPARAARPAAAAKAKAKAAPAAGDTIRAQEPKKPAATVQRRGGVRVYRLEEIKVEGRIQKPTAFYVLQRSSLNYELESLKQRFVPNILKSVSKSPF